MTSLTANLILQKTRLDNLRYVKKLNVCGVQIDDISTLANVPNLEVCSLSVNNIADLSAFVDTPMLRELYLRKNGVEELEQILYLTGAANLRTLNLSDNPVCTHPDYRQYTIAALSTLVQLDDSAVTREERDAAESSFPFILDDIRQLGSKPQNVSPKMAPANPPSFAAEPKSARLPAVPSAEPPLPPKVAPASARPQPAAAAQRGEENNGYNGDDVPVGGRVPVGPGMRRSNTDNIALQQARANKKQNAAAAPPSSQPQVARPAAAARSTDPRDAAMISAVITLLNDMTGEGRQAVHEHLRRLA